MPDADAAGAGWARARAPCNVRSDGAGGSDSMDGSLIIVGIAVALFTGVNNGGSSIGASFGPAVGSGIVGYRMAGVLMAGAVLAGGLIVGPNVVDTLGHKFVSAEHMSLPAAIGVLLFTSAGILFGNLRGVSVSTSETAVGAVAGLGAALGVLNWKTLAVVMSWWLVSPLIALAISAFIGRYFYQRLTDALRLSTESRKPLAQVAVVVIACYMGFSAGASNVANAVAPLVGAGELDMTSGILMGALAMGVGGFIFGPYTMRTVGSDITDLSMEGALIAMVIAATIITLLSFAGIPVSLAVTAITCVIGMGWGRQLAAQNTAKGTPDGEGNDQVRFSRATTVRIIVTWTGSPLIAFAPAYGVFALAHAAGLL